jgi:hypothetical protein
MEHPLYSPDLALYDFWLLPKLNYVRDDFRILKPSRKNYGNTESYSTTGVPKMFPTIIALLG